MRDEVGSGGHDPRHLDLIAAVALLLVIGAAYEFFSHRINPAPTTAFVEPSQFVKW